MTIRRRSMALFAALLIPVAQGAAAADLNPVPAPTRYHDAGPQPCGDATVLKRISRRFDHQVRHVPHLPQVAITSFEGIHEHRYLASHEDRPIARRYCNATAWMTDGRSRQVWYLIEYGQGFAGIGDNVEFCVSGFDRWNVYNGHCRILR